jgi:hypothetical protein
MNKVKTIISILTVSSLLVTASFAQANTDAKKIDRLIKRGDAEITRRVNSINKTITRIGKLKNLNPQQIKQFTDTLNQSIVDLNNLKTKLDFDKDLTTATADFKSITQDNRVYAVVIPQEEATASADNLLGRIAKLNSDIAKLATTSDKIVQANAKISEANNQIQTILTSAALLKVDHGDKAIIAANRSYREAIATALKTARTDVSDAEKIVRDLTRPVKKWKR